MNGPSTACEVHRTGVTETKSWCNLTRYHTISDKLMVRLLMLIRRLKTAKHLMTAKSVFQNFTLRLSLYRCIIIKKMFTASCQWENIKLSTLLAIKQSLTYAKTTDKNSTLKPQHACCWLKVYMHPKTEFKTLATTAAKKIPTYASCSCMLLANEKSDLRLA